MKKGILLIAVIAWINAGAQSLKQLLYSGKLKSDTGSVVRKGDDLSTKIDTSTRKPVEVEKPKIANNSQEAGSVLTPVAGDTSTGAAPVTKVNNTSLKDNNRIWKEFADSLASTMKTEVLSSKKIKSGTYYILIEYEIAPDGQVGVNNVSCSPENSFLAQQVKERITLTAPQMNPLLSTNGKAKKVVKKYTLILTKP